jgi:iron-sulfur cluster repair protein YtfE (RIC family)
MKRHDSLIPLSREHHGALILARLLQKDAPLYKDLPADPEGKAQYAMNFYDEELVKHFIQEEKIVPLVSTLNPQLDTMLETMVEEHAVLHQLFRLVPEAIDLPSHLDTLGKSLEKHVRKEEREIFPLIQQSCSPEILDKLMVLLNQP